MTVDAVVIAPVVADTTRSCEAWWPAEPGQTEEKGAAPSGAAPNDNAGKSCRRVHQEAAHHRHARSVVVDGGAQVPCSPARETQV